MSFAALGAAAAVAARAPDAGAQSVDPRRATTVIVGSSSARAPMARIDAARSGAVTEPLPGQNLHVAWRKTIGLPTEQPVLSLPDGTLAYVSTRGDVVFLADDGQDLGRVSAFAGGSVGPAVVLSDGTVAFATVSGEVIGVHAPSPRPRFVVQVASGRPGRAGPLPLADGGLVVAFGGDLVVVDATGGVRSRVSLPDPIAAPLVGRSRGVLAVTAAGAVYAWSFGREPHRVGTFGGPIDGGAALDGNSLLAVTEAGQLLALDLGSGSVTTRAAPSIGAFLGPPSVRPSKPGAAGTTTALFYGATQSFLVTLDETGQERSRAPVGPPRSATLVDAGTAPAAIAPHGGPLVDARGSAVVVTPEGNLSAVAPDGAVDGFAESVCTPTRRSAGVAGITPVGPHAFAVTCEGGVVVRIDGPGATRERRSRTAPIPSAGPRPPAPAAQPAQDDDDDDGED